MGALARVRRTRQSSSEFYATLVDARAGEVDVDVGRAVLAVAVVFFCSRRWYGASGSYERRLAQRGGNVVVTGLYCTLACSDGRIFILHDTRMRPRAGATNVSVCVSHLENQLATIIFVQTQHPPH